MDYVNYVIYLRNYKLLRSILDEPELHKDIMFKQDMVSV